MRIMLRAAIAAVSFANIGSAYAGDGTAPNTVVAWLPGVVEQAPAQHAPPVAAAQNGQTMLAYATQSNHGTWLYQPNQGGDGTSS